MSNTLLLCLSLVFAGMLFTCDTKAQLRKPTKVYRIAVIDSGFRPIAFSTAGFKLCSDGHYDFIKGNTEVGLDTLGHGAYVTDLINDYADTNNICFLIYKVFKGRRANQVDVNNALVKAYRAGARAINMSLDSSEPDARNKRILRILIKRGVKIFISAGNSNKNLNNECLNYPSCYKDLDKGLIIVGAKNLYGDRAKYSNYGVRLDVYEFGDIRNGGRGTSFAAPRALGNYIRSLKLDDK